MSTESASDGPVFYLPDPVHPERSARRVRPPREIGGMPADMVRDLLAGDLAAGQAVLDWLAERDDDGVRRHQFINLSNFVRELVCNAMHRASLADLEADREWAVSRYAAAAARDWNDFRRKVTKLFAWDLFSRDDALRFVAEVLCPGKLDGVTGE